VTVSESIAYSPPAKVIDFKAASQSKNAALSTEEISGEQSAQQIKEQRPARSRGAINLNQLDALEL
jgi:hypothetical protein